MTNALAIKGMRDGLLIIAPEGDWGHLHQALIEAVDGQIGFFRGARIALQTDERPVERQELADLHRALAKRDVHLQTLLSTSDEARQAAISLGIDCALPREEVEQHLNDTPIDTELDGETAVLVERTLRSGNVIRYPGHVIVLGDVNPGAEIIAGGHIIVWGRLRGTAHAGAAGDETSRVCALELSPTQLRIAGQIAVSPEARSQPEPEMASLRNGRVVAEPWKPALRR